MDVVGYNRVAESKHIFTRFDCVKLIIVVAWNN